jgi:DNA-3-methyladenine glycosylase II
MDGPRTTALTRASLAEAVHELGSRDPDLAAIVSRYGMPPLWDRPPGFATLAHIVLEQQVSLASANAAFGRLRAAIDPVTPHGFLTLDDRELLDIGFSRQKAAYVRGIAGAVASGGLDFDTLDLLGDEDVQRRLVSLKGVGPWTAHIYLIEVLGRPDVWPIADIALATAVAEAKGLARRPSPQELVSLGSAWMPWRSVAARILWLGYLGRRNRLPTG